MSMLVQVTGCRDCPMSDMDRDVCLLAHRTKPVEAANDWSVESELRVTGGRPPWCQLPVKVEVHQ